MAGPTRISQLTDGSPVQPTDQVPVARGSGATGYTYKVNAGRIVSDLFNVANTPTVDLTFDTSTRTLSAVANIPETSVNVVDSPTIDLNWNASTRTLSATTSVVPVGSVMAFPSTTAPSGWIKLNGASLLRVDYPELWVFAQASGNLVTDTSWYSTSATGSFSQGNGSTTFRIPDLRGEFVRAWDDSRGTDSGRGIGVWQIDAFKAHNHGLNYAGGNVALGSNAGIPIEIWAGAPLPTNFGDGGTSTETRPRNISLLYCIKF